MPEVQLKTRLLLEVVRPGLEPGQDAEPAQFPDRVLAELPEEFQVLAVRTGSSWVEVPAGGAPSERDLRAAARAVLTDEMLASGSVTVAPLGVGHVEFGPLWRATGGAEGSAMTLYPLGKGEGAAFEAFARPVGSGGDGDPLERAVLRVSIAVSRA